MGDIISELELIKGERDRLLLKLHANNLEQVEDAVAQKERTSSAENGHMTTSSDSQYNFSSRAGEYFSARTSRSSAAASKSRSSRSSAAAPKSMRGMQGDA